MNFEQALETFRKDYQGPKIAFFIAGGGFSILDFRKYPGSSKMYHTAIEPYNEDTANFLNRFNSANIADPHSFPFVNEEGTISALQSLSNYCDNPSLLYVVINSACTTDRYRRGENRAYIATSRGDIFLLEIAKLSQEEYSVLSAKGQKYIDQIRFDEDRKISQAAIAVIMGSPSMLPVFEPGESLIRLNKMNGFVPNQVDSVHH